jgi:hypothetical protein
VEAVAKIAHPEFSDFEALFSADVYCRLSGAMEQRYPGSGTEYKEMQGVSPQSSGLQGFQRFENRVTAGSRRRSCAPRRRSGPSTKGEFETLHYRPGEKAGDNRDDEIRAARLPKGTTHLIEQMIHPRPPQTAKR